MKKEYTVIWIDNKCVNHVVHMGDKMAACSHLHKLFTRPEFRFGQVLDYYGIQRYQLERGTAV